MFKSIWALALALQFIFWPGAAFATSEVSLGAAKCFALLSSGAGATLALSGANSTIRGRVGLGKSAVQDFTTGEIIGQLDVDPAANDTRANTVVIDGGTVNAALTLDSAGESRRRRRRGHRGVEADAEIWPDHRQHYDRRRCRRQR